MFITAKGPAAPTTAVGESLGAAFTSIIANATASAATAQPDGPRG